MKLLIIGVFERTNDCPGQPEEPKKLKENSKKPSFLKLYIKFWSNKPNRVAR